MKRFFSTKSWLALLLVLFLTEGTASFFHFLQVRHEYRNSLTRRGESLANLLNLLSSGDGTPNLSQICSSFVKANPSFARAYITDRRDAVVLSTETVAPDFSEGGIGMHLTFPIKLSSKPDQHLHLIINHVQYDKRVKKMACQNAAIFTALFFVSSFFVALAVHFFHFAPIAALMVRLKSTDDKTVFPSIKGLELALERLLKLLEGREEEIEATRQITGSVERELEKALSNLAEADRRMAALQATAQSLLNGASDAVILVNKDGNIERINSRTTEMLGTRENLVIGRPLSALFVPQPKTLEQLDIFWDACRSVPEQKAELEVTTILGSNLILLLHATRIEGENGLYVQLIIHDATKEREVVHNLEQSAAELARLNKMKDSFLGLASHELKTPLTVILGYSELILSSHRDRMDAAVLSMVENIANAAGRLDSIVRDMVDLSLMDENKLQLRREEIDMNQIVRDSVQELAFFFDLRKQTLKVQLQDNLPVIKGDSVRLMQLMTNLLGNAIKFTPDNGTITVTSRLKYQPRARMPFISEYRQGGDSSLYVEVVVADTGIGIDREDHLRIFEKFYEVGNIDEHSSGKVAFKGKGAGLGLAVAKGIVDMHGGKIWVESPGYNPNDFPGSKFHILLPIHAAISDTTAEYLSRFS